MKILKFLGLVVLAVVLLAAGSYFWAVSTATAKYEKHWTAHEEAFPIPFPLDSVGLAELRAERIAAGASAKDPLTGVDLAAAARERAVKNGERLLSSRLACAGCHGANLGGSVVIDVPVVGYWAAPNLTSGQGSVTKTFTAHDWDLAVRHGIRHTGKTSTMPAGEFVDLADHDLSDVVAYIQSRPPVDHVVPPSRIGPVFAVLMATNPKLMLAFNIDHQKPHRAEPPAHEVSVELGRYIAQNCSGCHNEKFSGGKLEGDPNMPIVANITPDSTGIGGWTEADFMNAIRNGKRPDSTVIAPQMPWLTYRHMDDVEIKSLWAFLQTLPATPKGKH